MRDLGSGINSMIVIGSLAGGLLAAQAQMQPIPPSALELGGRGCRRQRRFDLDSRKVEWNESKMVAGQSEMGRLSSESESAKACRAQKLARNRQLHDSLDRRRVG